MRFTVAGGLIAAGVTLSGAGAGAQPPELIQFALRPSSLVQVSASGNTSDSSTTVSGEKTENHVAERSALAGLAISPVAVGAITQRSENEEISSGLEVGREQSTDAALAAFHFVTFALVAGTNHTAFSSRLDAGLAELDFDLKTDADYELGVVVAVAGLTLAYIRGRGEISLDLEATGISDVKEDYPLDSTDLVADVRFGEEKGFFFGATYINSIAVDAGGGEVDFGGSETTSWDGTVGYANPKGFQFSVSAGTLDREIRFPEFLVITQKGTRYGARFGFNEHFGLFANRKHYDTTEDVRFAGYEAETDSSALEVGLDYRF